MCSFCVRKNLRRRQGAQVRGALSTGGGGVHTCRGDVRFFTLVSKCLLCSGVKFNMTPNGEYFKYGPVRFWRHVIILTPRRLCEIPDSCSCHTEPRVSLCFVAFLYVSLN